MPGYRVFEYLVVLDPNEDLRNRIIRVRQELSESIREAPGLGGRPNLALVNFLQYEMMEERLVNRLKAVAMGYFPVMIELKDFGSFPTHTIYIGVTSKLPIQNLVREIRSQAQRLMRLNEDNKPHFISEPYVPVARKLLPWQYELALRDYASKHFTGRFIADGIWLLKRPLDGKKYQVVEKFPFQNLPVVTKQGALFP